MNTNYYFSYLDFPNIPNDLLPSPQEVIDYPYWSNGEKFESIRHPWAKENYHRKKLSKELKNWLCNNILPNEDLAACWVVFNSTMQPHRDVRDETYNYILQTGGTIFTEWYNKQQNNTRLATWDSIRPDTSHDKFDDADKIITLESVLIDAKKWHRIKTDVVHGTKGTMTCPRIILSVITSKMVQAPSNPVLKEAIENWFKEW